MTVFSRGRVAHTACGAGRSTRWHWRIFRWLCTPRPLYGPETPSYTFSGSHWPHCSRTTTCMSKLSLGVKWYVTTYNHAAVAAVWVKTLTVRSSNAACTSKEHSNNGENADHVNVDEEDIVGVDCGIMWLWGKWWCWWVFVEQSEKSPSLYSLAD